MHDPDKVIARMVLATAKSPLMTTAEARAPGCECPIAYNANESTFMTFIGCGPIVPIRLRRWRRF
jgi:hypothetical protein